MAGSQQYGWTGSDVGMPLPLSREVEEGELSDGVPSSYEDASPRSLVIDAQDHDEQMGSPASAPPTPPIEMTTPPIELDTPPIFTTINAPSPPPTSYPPTSSSFDFPPLLPTYLAPVSNQTATSSSQSQAATPTLNSVMVSEEDEEVKFVVKVEVSGKDFSPVDILCIYKFRWDREYIEVITRQKCAPLIPVKNLYLKAIPGLKQNVLSARISKLGIRSLVLPEPYITTVKKLGLGLNGSSHYVTISDFVKICTYFKRQAPALVGKFDFVSSDLDPEEVLHLFNDPDTTSSKELLTQLSEEAAKRDPSAGNVAGIRPGARGADLFSHRSDGSNPDGSFNISEVDARKLTLPDGQPLYFIVKEGVAFLPNPELAKILPAVSRTAMEHIRNSYGISVEQATKTHMAMLKFLGVVSVKAGRTLLYKAVDVITMFKHWRTAVPDFVKQLAQGYIPEEKVLVGPKNYQPSSGSSLPLSAAGVTKRTSSPHNQSGRRPSPHTHTPSAPLTSHPLYHSNMSVKQESYSHAPHGSDRPSPKTTNVGHNSSRDNLYPMETSNSPRIPHSNSTSMSRSTSRDGIERSGSFPVSKGSRRADFSMSGKGVEQINLASASSSSLSTGGLDGSQYGGRSSDNSWVSGSSPISEVEQRTSADFNPEQDFSSTLITEDRQAAILEGRSGGGGASPGEMLMPETFQLPVHMLSSISGGVGRGSGVMSGGGGKPSFASSGVVSVGKGSSPSMSSLEENRLSNRGSSQKVSSGMSTEGKMRERNKRRGSSSGPLDDQTLEYSVVQWGEESLTLLTPDVGMEGYLAIPELIRKVFKSRSYVSGEIRTKLGIHILPASALQILTLRTRGSIEITTGNIKLLCLSDAVKLAVAGNVEVPGSIIHLLKRTSLVPLDDVLSPKILSDEQLPPLSKKGRYSAAPKGLTFVPSHPDILPLAPNWKLGALYQVKWGRKSVVIYLNPQNLFSVCLYQVYENLFKPYVNRINFKMRMKKLKIWSSRATFPVRTKLVNVGAIPNSCPVCCMISVLELEKLASSYGIERPQVLYECFLNQSEHQDQNQNQNLNPSTNQYQHLNNNHQHQNQNQMDYQSEDPVHHRTVKTPPTQPYGVVPYLTSSHAGGRPGSSSSSVATSPNLITTSLGTKATDQSYFPANSPAVDRNESGAADQSYYPSDSPAVDGNRSSDTSPPLTLVVSIPRRHSPYKIVSSASSGTFTTSSNQGTIRPHPSTGGLDYRGSRGKVLQTLAKKISQKSKRHAAASSMGMMKLPTNQNSASSAAAAGVHSSQSAPGAMMSLSGLDPSTGTRTCPSCGNVNPKHKKRCCACYEFLVGVNCPSCSVLNYYRAKTCFRCGASMPGGWEAISMATAPMTTSSSSSTAYGGDGDGSKGSEVATSAGVGVSQYDGLPSSRETSEGASSLPNSPTSPKYSAPPIRSAVLKSLFPQKNDGHQKQEGGGAAGKSGGVGVAGAMGPTRECPECRYLNTRMAKKCVRCKGHLQGRACTSCGRPNLNHVTECYKCGASLPPASSKYVYVGSHSGRAYKNLAIAGSNDSKSHKISVTTENIETKLLLSKAPVTCIRCSNIRASGFFKCSRCGDAFKAQPVVAPTWEKGSGKSGQNQSTKRQRESNDEANSEKDKIDSSLLSSFASHILTLGFQEHLTPLFRATEEVSRQQLEAAQEELEAADAIYQSTLSKKLECEQKFLDQQASVDATLVQIETYTKALEDLSKEEEECNRLIEELPAQISAVQAKLNAYDQLMAAN